LGCTQSGPGFKQSRPGCRESGPDCTLSIQGCTQSGPGCDRLTQSGLGCTQRVDQAGLVETLGLEIKSGAIMLNNRSTYQNDFNKDAGHRTRSYSETREGKGGGAQLLKRRMSGAFSKPVTWGPAKPALTTSSFDNTEKTSISSQPSFSYQAATRPAPGAKISSRGRASFTPADWAASNMSHYNSADASRQESERIRNEAVILMRDREDKAVMTQRDADRRIGERIGDETHWRSEIQKELELNLNFTHNLEKTKKDLENALAETEGPMRVNAENFHHRCTFL